MVSAGLCGVKESQRASLDVRSQLLAALLNHMQLQGSVCNSQQHLRTASARHQLLPGCIGQLLQILPWWCGVMEACLHLEAGLGLCDSSGSCWALLCAVLCRVLLCTDRR